MKKIGFILLLILYHCQSLSAQQYPLFTNYVVNGFGFNPAVAGAKDYADARFVYRTQWQGVEAAPQTGLVWLHSKLKNQSPFGVGGYLYSDEAGSLGKKGFALNGTYSRKLSEGTKLHFGVSAGYYNISVIDNTVIRDESDPIVIQGKQGIWSPDLNIGLFLQSGNIFAGISVPQLFQKKIDFDPATFRLNTATLVRQYYGVLGYNYKLNSKMSIEPSVLVKYSPAAPVQFDGSARLIFANGFWLGGSYRSQDAIAGMIGLDLSKFTLAYSYDVTTSKLNSVSAGSHEITFGLKFGNGKCTDKDGDGICDKEDSCPDEPGTKENKGCPEKKEDKTIKDKDKDGVPDDQDLCPDVPGPKTNKGCPPNFADKDGDGIRDDIDKCPDIPGSARNEGCPLSDRDKDGILDEVDPCPDIWGPINNGGCPQESDRDKDGTPDSSDPCPDVSGPRENKGCPASTDRDGDGVNDDIDKCPNTAGTSANNGCPNITDEDKEILTLAIRDLYFDTDKFIIRPYSFRHLNNLADLLKKKKDWKVKITGHADPRGNKEHNLMLSRNRANAAKNYLISKGVSPNALLTEYYGDSVPANKGNDANSLQMNRRVEMEFVFD
jgi:type IX secretion system PorP/SprF family membrane protein